MKATLEFELPEDEAELKISVQAMELLCSLRDFYDRLRTLKKHGHGYQSADEAIDCLLSDYCDAMQRWIDG